MMTVDRRLLQIAVPPAVVSAVIAEGTIASIIIVVITTTTGTRYSGAPLVVIVVAVVPIHDAKLSWDDLDECFFLTGGVAVIMISTRGGNKKTRRAIRAKSRKIPSSTLPGNDSSGIVLVRTLWKRACRAHASFLEGDWAWESWVAGS